MITKGQFTEQVIHRLCGGDPSAEQLNRFHPNIVDKEIDMAYESILNGLFHNNVRGADFSLFDAYTKTYISPRDFVLEFDDDRQEYFFTLPVPPIVINPGNLGIRMICPREDQSDQFAPIDNNALVVFNELEVGSISETSTYYMEGQKAYLNFLGGYTSKMLIKMVPTYSYLEDDDMISIPEMMTKSGMITVEDMVVQRLLGMPPTDLRNDNNPTPA